jgi:hypothetical protein
MVGSGAAPSEISRGMDDYVERIDDAERQIITQDVMASNQGATK